MTSSVGVVPLVFAFKLLEELLCGLTLISLDAWRAFIFAIALLISCLLSTYNFLDAV
ncbi:Hypothetical protein ADU71_0310 [Pediococcus damnosus]|nr:Hypothetical protein ADU71_0310 [Pediococcus damnosus]